MEHAFGGNPSGSYGGSVYGKFLNPSRITPFPTPPFVLLDGPIGASKSSIEEVSRREGWVRGWMADII